MGTACWESISLASHYSFLVLGSFTLSKHGSGAANFILLCSVQLGSMKCHMTCPVGPQDPVSQHHFKHPPPFYASWIHPCLIGIASVLGSCKFVEYCIKPYIIFYSKFWVMKKYIIYFTLSFGETVWGKRVVFRISSSDGVHHSSDESSTYTSNSLVFYNMIIGIIYMYNKVI